MLRYGVVRFVWFSYHKTANRTTSCGVVRCDALLLAVRCTVTCSAVRLYHFAGGFSTVFAVCAV